MSDNNNSFTWDVKHEDQEPEKKPADYTHPGWQTFLKNYFPAEPEEDPEYLTTGEILERLNTIVDDSGMFGYTEKDLFTKLQEAGFKQRLIGELILWMVSNQRRITAGV